MKKVCLLLGFVLLLTACPIDKGELIWVKNNSNQTIVVTAGYILPDTLLPEKYRRLVTISVNKSDYIEESYVEGVGFQRMKNGERLTLFVLSKDSVDNYSWEYIRENNVVLKRYEFNWAELEMMGDGGKNRTVTYP